MGAAEGTERAGRCETTTKSLQLGEVLSGREKPDVLSVSKKDKDEHQGNYRLHSFTSWPGKIMEYILISKHIKNKTTTRKSRHGFSKGKLCLACLNAALA